MVCNDLATVGFQLKVKVPGFSHTYFGYTRLRKIILTLSPPALFFGQVQKFFF